MYLNNTTNKMNENYSFEFALAKLENIVRQLDEGNKSLDETLKLYEEGIHLFRYCTDKLENAQQRINMIQGNDEISFFAFDHAGKED